MPLQNSEQAGESSSLKQTIEYLRYRKDKILSDVFNIAAEYKQLRKAKPALQREAPQGDGHPVLVIPAFTANDWLNAPLRHILSKKGYKTYGWKGGINLGLKEKKSQHLRKRLKEIYEMNGNQKVTIIGHSLGGFYARALAQEFPDMVRDVITIATPFGIGMKKDGPPPTVLTVIEKLSDAKYSMKNKGVPERMLTPPSAPTTSIFSKQDIGDWKLCLNPNTPLSENIEIEATHLGSILSKETVAIILDRLAQPDGHWKRSAKASKIRQPANPRWTAPKSSNSWRFF